MPHSHVDQVRPSRRAKPLFPEEMCFPTAKEDPPGQPQCFCWMRLMHLSCKVMVLPPGQTWRTRHQGYPGSLFPGADDVLGQFWHTNSSIRPNYLRFMFFLGWGDLAMHMSSHDMSQEHLRPTRCNWMWSFMALPCQSASNRGNGPWLCTSSATCVERPSLARTQTPLVIWWTKS